MRIWLGCIGAVNNNFSGTAFFSFPISDYFEFEIEV